MENHTETHTGLCGIKNKSNKDKGWYSGITKFSELRRTREWVLAAFVSDLPPQKKKENRSDQLDASKPPGIIGQSAESL